MRNDTRNWCHRTPDGKYFDSMRCDIPWVYSQFAKCEYPTLFRFPETRKTSFLIAIAYRKNDYSRRLSGMITAMRIDLDTCRDLELLAGEVRRLRAVIASEQTLTDEERAALRTVIGGFGMWVAQNGLTDDESLRLAVVALRGLLERTGGGA